MAPIPGVSLAQIATGAAAETDQRLAGGAALGSAALASEGATYQALLDSTAQQQGTGQTFSRAQAILAEAIQMREQAMQVAEQQARLRFEEEQAALQRAFMATEGGLNRAHDMSLANIRNSGGGGGGGGGGGDNFYAQEAFRTDENIRQALAIAAIEEQARRRGISAERGAANRAAKIEGEAARPRLSSFGSQHVDYDRGRILTEHRRAERQRAADRWYGRKAPSYPVSGGLSGRTMQRVDALIDQNTLTPDSDYFTLTQLLRRELGAERASIALYQLGLGPPGGLGPG